MSEHNVRTPEIWNAIAGAVDVEGLRIIDLGCGYGDLAYRCHIAGAADVLGIDRNMEPLLGQRRKHWKGRLRGLRFTEMNIDALTASFHKWKPPFDLALCFSVLPYLRNWRDTLSWLAMEYERSLIECQYWGDGPGPPDLRDDEDFKFALNQAGFSEYESIGGSLVKDRGIVRTIWLATR